MELYEEVANALLNTNRRNSGRAKPEDVRSAVVALRASQFLFESRSPSHFALLKSMRSSLEPHFELSGSRLVVDDVEGYVALVPIEDVSRLPLSVEETLILLTLRWIFETKVELRDVETDGSVRADEAEIQQWYEKNCGRTWPKRPVVKTALDLFERRSLIVSSTDDMDNRVVFIRGVVRLVTGSDWTTRLNAFLEAVAGRAELEASSDNPDAVTAASENLTSGDVE